jgi:VWFA-related protein
MPARTIINKMATAGLAVCLVLLPFNTAGQTGRSRQDQTEVVRVYTELVQTDVSVFDKQGNFVDKLRKEDFELRIDGKVRPIDFFERVTVGSVNEESQLRAARGTLNTSTADPVPPVPLDRGRIVFFYIDDLHLGASSMNSTRKLIIEFIDKQMYQNDEAAITSASGQIGFLQQLTDNKSVLRSAVERLKPKPYSVRDMERPPMSEYQALLIDRENSDVKEYFIREVIRQNPMMTPDIAEQIVRSRSTAILQQASNTTRNTLIGLAGLVKNSRQLPGRKLVFFISDGFLLDNRNSDSMERLQRITSDAARSGIVIYSLDARGLVATLNDVSVEQAFDPTGQLERGSAGELNATQDALYALAKDTGGRAVFNTNALGTGVTRALNESSVYYLLAWKPEQAGTGSSKFRRIEVKLLGKPDLTVRVRRGFYDTEPGAESKSGNQKPVTKTPQEQLRAALGAPYPDRVIPVALNLNYVNTPENKMLLSTSLQIPSQFISFTPEEGKHKGTVQVAGSIFNEKGQAGGHFEEQITVTAVSMGPIKEGNESIAYTYPITVEPGLYQVRVAVRDEKTGHTGSAHAWIEIPDLSNHKLKLSSLIIGSAKDRTTNVSSSDTPAPQLGMSIDRQFKRDSILRFLFMVYNATRASADSMPDVASQVQILRDNQPVVTTSLKKIPTVGVDLARLPYAADLSLQGLPAGQYVLHVTAIDRVSKTSASQQTRFAIE